MTIDNLSASATSTTVDPAANDAVAIRVGDRLFNASREVLLGASYFSHLLKNKKRKRDDEPYFVPRDGDVFEHVLRFLTYKDLGTLSNDMRRLVLSDADFYGLPALKERATASLKLRVNSQITSHRGMLLLQSAKPHASILVWKNSECDNRYYTPLRIDTSSLHDVHSVMIVEEGDYFVNIRALGDKEAENELILSCNDVQLAYCEENEERIMTIKRIYNFKMGDILTCDYMTALTSFWSIAKV
ncbi:hypothetical protein HK101_004068 [Irineochytrium annulatum]|nr:hypothetical protein HK101_004068 [Irineochytrium annulatum]